MAAGRPFHIRFGGPIALQYADDVAKIFLACARSGHQGWAACNLRNDVVDVGEFVELIMTKYPGAEITYQPDNLLPFPSDLDDSGLQRILGKVPHTAMDRAMDETVEMFRQLLAHEQVDLKQLEA